MSDLHRYIGYSIPASFALLALWAGYALIRNKAPNNWFWNILAFAQVVLGVQVVVGITLYLRDLRPPVAPNLHFLVYGSIGPAIVLIAAHRFARRTEGAAWLIFGVAGLVNFGLTFRGVQTGMGWA